jgi:hypothetical protein
VKTGAHKGPAGLGIDPYLKNPLDPELRKLAFNPKTRIPEGLPEEAAVAGEVLPGQPAGPVVKPV